MVLPWIISLMLHASIALTLLAVPTRPSNTTFASIELVERALPDLPLQPEAAPKQAKEPVELPLPKEVAPASPPPRSRVRRRRVTPKPPKGEQEAEQEAAPDTAPKAFGIEMEGTVAEAGGEGVALPEGESVAESPAATRRGKGTTDGAPTGFEKDYAPGDDAPLAVITSMPRVLEQVVPEYPDRMKELGVEGKVILALLIGAQGEVVESTVETSLHPMLDQAAQVAAQKMRFSPALVNDTPVRVKISYTFSFVLD